MLYTDCRDEYGNSITHLTQWDLNQTIYIDIGEEDFIIFPVMYFSNSESEAATEVPTKVNGSVVSVTIPDQFLKYSGILTMNLYVAHPKDSSSKKTLLTIRMPVRERIKPFIDESKVSVSLNKTTLTLSSGGTQQLIATISPFALSQKVTWSSSKSSVATVSEGLVKAVASGTCSITASYGGTQASCAVTVQ